MERTSRRVLLGSLLLVPVAVAQEKTDSLVVHEWGTFTCLMDDDGTTLAGVNTEDEPLPRFVVRPLAQRHGNGLLIPPGDLAPGFAKGASPCHPDVRMRLETPVVYFHLPKGCASLELDLEVAWRGGWLSEFYPPGEATLPGSDEGPIGHLDPARSGTLAWRNVMVGGASDVPMLPCNDNVWLAPRRVSAADVHVGGATERFLFYRGVGNVDAPLRVRRDKEGTDLTFAAAPGSVVPQMSTGPCWLVEVDAERGCAFRELAPLRLDSARKDEVAGRAHASFVANDFAAANLDRLRASMHRALVEDGLFADEADALLDTWRVSYFRTPGLRLFALLPQQWTDAVMPLRFSVPAQVDRVMVARIELIRPAQRAALARIAAGPVSDPGWFNGYLDRTLQKDPEHAAQAWQDLMLRPGALTATPGLDLPEDYRAYLALGRFRNALVLDAARFRPTKALNEFVERYGLSR